MNTIPLYTGMASISVQPILRASVGTTPSLNYVLPFPECDNGRLWLDRNQGITLDGNSKVESWQSIGGDWTENTCVQDDPDARPAFHPLGITPDGVDDWMEFSQIDLPSTWTIYVVGDGYPESTSGYDNLRVCGIRDNYPYEGISLSALNYGSSWHSYQWVSQYQSYLTPTHKMPKNKWLLRFRRAADWHHFLQATSEDEADTFSNSWTDQITYQWIRLFKTYAVTNQSACTFRLKQLVIAAEDTVATGADVAIRAKLKQLEGVDL